MCIGPYFRKSDNRKQFTFKFKDGTMSSKQYAKALYEAYYNVCLGWDETVDHIDNDPTNDSIGNLQILSRSENARKSHIGKVYPKGYKQPPEHIKSGEKNGQSEMTNEEVLMYRLKFCSNELTRREIEELSGLSDRSIRNMLTGVSYKDAGGPLTILTRGRYNK